MLVLKRKEFTSSQQLAFASGLATQQTTGARGAFNRIFRPQKFNKYSRQAASFQTAATQDNTQVGSHIFRNGRGIYLPDVHGFNSPQYQNTGYDTVSAFMPNASKQAWGDHVWAGIQANKPGKNAQAFSPVARAVNPTTLKAGATRPLENVPLGDLNSAGVVKMTTSKLNQQFNKGMAAKGMADYSKMIYTPKK